MGRDLFVVAMNHFEGSWVIKDESKYENIEWLSEDVPKPSEEEVMAKLKEVQDAEPMRVLRIKREKVLEKTDKYMTFDFPMTEDERVAMRDYRQMLRDLPQEGITEIPEPPLIIKHFVV
jgi:hypothetical protein